MERRKKTSKKALLFEDAFRDSILERVPPKLREEAKKRIDTVMSKYKGDAKYGGSIAAANPDVLRQHNIKK